MTLARRRVAVLAVLAVAASILAYAPGGSRPNGTGTEPARRRPSAGHRCSGEVP